MRRSTFVLCVAAGLLGACSKGQEAPKTVPQQTAASATPAPFQVSRIDLGTALGADKRIATPSTTFKPADTIYASILSTGAAPSVKLTAKWTYQDGQTVSESSQTIAPTGPAATEFHIVKPDGWPLGKYKIEVTANDKPAGTMEFTVAE